MSKKPPNRPGISFEVGARVEAQDYLKKWYSSRIEELDHEEGKMLVHFDRWSHRYDEWISWDSTRLRPLERPVLRKEGLKEEEEMTELRDGEEVLARWTDCRYYPAKIESVNKEAGTYTVEFYDGVVRSVKRIHIKSMPEDAKGQDWVALVKAASAASRNKGSSSSSKPRTSANSNKDRDDTGGEQSDDDEEDEVEGDPDEDRQKQSHTEKPGVSRDLVGSQGEPRAEVELPHKHAPSASPSPTKGGGRRSKHQSGESTSSNPSQPSSAPLSVGEENQLATKTLPSPDLPSALPAPSGPAPLLRTPDSSQQRRRSQRLAPTTPDAPTDLSHSLADATPRPPSPPAKEPRPAQKESSPERAAVNPVERVESSLHNYCAGMPPTPPSTAPITGQNQQTDGLTANHTVVGEKSSPLIAAPGQRMTARTPKMNKHTREPIMSTLRSEDPSSPGDVESQFQCQVAGCAKAFRKAKLLDYHLKYYHNADREAQDPEAGSPDRVGRTRATSTCLPLFSNPLLDVPDNKRRRTISSSSSLSPQAQALQLDCIRSGSIRTGRKKRSSASMSSDSTEVSLPPPPRDPRDRSLDNLHDKILKKVIDKDKYSDTGFIKIEKKVKLEEKGQMMGRKKEKERDRRDRKDKDPFKLKQKKKKKKKKKSKQHNYADYDSMSLAFLDRSSSTPLHRSSGSAFTFLSSSTKHHQYPRAILSVDLTGENLSDVEYLEDSTTESLLLSGDELSQEDLAMEDFASEEPQASQEIVRCVCQMDEENGFMIQCEECMCWQHSVCMGLLEDSIPDQYICYICRDPPGQRWSARYRHDRDWLTKGHMVGLSFLAENYSQQNGQKIVSTHQLLADAYSLDTLLHGLALKMDILQNRHSPSLHFWARSWVNSDEDQPMGGLPDCLHFQEVLGDSENQNSSLPDTYITSEHSYQKPPGTPGHGTQAVATEPRLAVDTLSCSREQEEDLGTALGVGTNTHPVEPEERAALVLPGPDSVEHARNCLQWQMNLLTHIEDVQNQLAGRMDLIEKEVDVLESWLDLSGELEPPDPLARLPQLKLRIKQLLSDLSKVQQMSTLCSA